MSISPSEQSEVMEALKSAYSGGFSQQDKCIYIFGYEIQNKALSLFLSLSPVHVHVFSCRAARRTIVKYHVWDSHN